MLRRHAIPLFIAIVAVSVVLPFSLLLALVPLYWIAADRGLGPAVAAGAVLTAAQLADLDHWAEPVAAPSSPPPPSRGARFMRGERGASCWPRTPRPRSGCGSRASCTTRSATTCR